MRVVVTGRLTKSEKAAILGKLSGIGLGGQKRVTTDSEAAIEPNAVTHVDRPSKSNIYYVLGKLGLPVRGYEQVACQDIIESYLFDFQNAAIYRRARVEGLAYGVAGSFNEDTKDTQNFYVYGSVSEKNTAALLRVIREGLTEVFVNPSEQILEQVRRYVLGQNMGALDSPDAIHDRALTHMRRFGRPMPLELALTPPPTNVIRDIAKTALQGGVAVAGTAAQKPLLIEQFQEALEFIKQL
jgi:predicted Zn-dependent peptidase